VTGDIDQRISVSTGLPTKEALLETIRSKPIRRTTDLLVPSSCNQNCTHCHFVEDGSQGFLRPSQQLAQEIRQRIDFLRSQEPQGGINVYPREITVFPEVLQIRQELGRKMIYTNAALVDEECAKELVGLGVRSAQVSLHGDEQHHRDLTGVDSRTYKNTLAGIEHLRNSGIIVNILTALY